MPLPEGVDDIESVQSDSGIIPPARGVMYFTILLAHALLKIY